MGPSGPLPLPWRSYLVRVEQPGKNTPQCEWMNEWKAFVWNFILSTIDLLWYVLVRLWSVWKVYHQPIHKTFNGLALLNGTINQSLDLSVFFAFQVIGYSIVAIAFLMQPAMRWLCDRLPSTPRLLVADLFLLFSLVSTINVWRGLWNLLNIYLLPGKVQSRIHSTLLEALVISYLRL